MTTLIDPPLLEDEIRRQLDGVARLRVPAATLGPEDDLYAAGLSSLATVDLMLAIEDHFAIEFGGAWLNRRTFGTVASLAAAVRAMRGDAP